MSPNQESKITAEYPLWDILDTGIQKASFNMALDDILLERSLQGLLKTPLFRFYGWESPSISLGRYQLIHKDIHLSNCFQDSIPLVRRPTGGRAVFHDDELTYSVIIPPGHNWARHSLMESYAMISKILVKGMKSIGLDVDFEKHTQGLKTYPHQASCFASTTPYEVTLKGYKIIGSAQYRHGGAILQQGSILISVKKGISAYFNTNEFLQKGIKDIVNIDVNSESLKQKIKDALSMGNIKPLPLFKLPDDISDLAHELALNKYETERWTFSR